MERQLKSVAVLTPVNVAGLVGKTFRLGFDGITSIVELEAHRKTRVRRGEHGVGYICEANYAAMEYVEGQEPGAPAAEPVYTEGAGKGIRGADLIGPRSVDPATPPAIPPDIAEKAITAAAEILSTKKRGPKAKGAA